MISLKKLDDSFRFDCKLFRVGGAAFSLNWVKVLSYNSYICICP